MSSLRRQGSTLPQGKAKPTLGTRTIVQHSQTEKWIPAFAGMTALTSGTRTLSLTARDDVQIRDVVIFHINLGNLLALAGDLAG